MPAAAPVRIVALGDSLTSGHRLPRSEAYPARLQAALAEEGVAAVVFNHGVSGDTSSGGVRRLSAALDDRPDILIVALGVNDGLRGVPVTQVRRNLETIIETAQARGVTVVLCAMEALPLYGWQYTVDFHNLYMALADKYQAVARAVPVDGCARERRSDVARRHPPEHRRRPGDRVERSCRTCGRSWSRARARRHRRPQDSEPLGPESRGREAFFRSLARRP